MFENQNGTRPRHVKCAAGALLLSFLLAGCGTEPSANATPAVDGTAPVADDTVRRGSFRQTLLLSGTLSSRNSEAVIIPRMPSWETTIRWMADDGAEVIEGAPLVELDTAQLASEIENKITAQQQAQNAIDSKLAEIAGQLEERQFSYEQQRIALRKAEIEADVPLDVTDRKTYQEAQLALQQARVEYDKADADLEGHGDSSEAELEVLRVDLRSAEREVAEAQRAIETMVLRAPQSGIAVAAENRREDRKFQVGDTIWVGATVAEIPDLRSMAVEARLSDVDDGKVTPGMIVACTLDAYPDRSFTGVVREISPVAHESGWRSEQRHFLVHNDLDEAEPEIMQPGMSVRVEVETAARDEALLVARAALSFTDDGATVRLPGGATQPVELGPCNARECIVREGLAEGARVEVAR